MLIKNVLAPSYKADLVAAVKEKQFSLIIDEATDVSLQKTLGMIILYPNLQFPAILQDC